LYSFFKKKLVWTNSFSISLSNGTNNFSASQSASLNKAETYSASPKAKGYKVSINLYAKKLVAQRVKMDCYSKATGKYSHTAYTNKVITSGIYVGQSHSK